MNREIFTGKTGFGIIAGAAVIAVALPFSIAALRTPPRLSSPAHPVLPTPKSLPLAKVVPPKPVFKKVDYNALKPNELGRIPILMYHSLGDHTTYKGRRYDVDGLNIAPDTFRHQLDLMRAANWYPVNMRDLLNPHLNIPAGKTPVVLTWDDSRQSQFRYLKDGRIDPDCAVGILLAFHKKYMDWPLRSTFYVLPNSSYNPVPFQQAGTETKKLRWLSDNGFEIANHSTTHRRFSIMDEKTLEWEMAHCAQYVQNRAPKAQMDTMALPYGIRPRNRYLLQRLIDDGTKNSPYHNKCVLLAAGNASFAPWDKRFDPLNVQRCGTEPGNVEFWVKTLRRNGKPTVRPFVSDGDPNTIAVPKSLEKYVNIKRLYGTRLVAYSDAVPKAVKPVAAVPKTSSVENPSIAAAVDTAHLPAKR